ncbi:hypothetical protein VTN96DRAFT_5732 [Rasamsonia emersonii]
MTYASIINDFDDVPLPLCSRPPNHHQRPLMHRDRVRDDKAPGIWNATLISLAAFLLLPPWSGEEKGSEYVSTWLGIY